MDLRFFLYTNFFREGRKVIRGNGPGKMGYWLWMDDFAFTELGPNSRFLYVMITLFPLKHLLSPASPARVSPELDCSSFLNVIVYRQDLMSY